MHEGSMEYMETHQMKKIPPTTQLINGREQEVIFGMQLLQMEEGMQ